MFQDTRSVSWGARCFLWQGLTGRPRRIDRLEPNDRALKIEDDAKVPEEISAEDTALLEARRLVDWFEIEYRRVDLFASVRAQDYLWQQRNLYVLGNTGRAENAHSILLNEINRTVEFGGTLGKHTHGGAGIDDEIQRLLNSFNCDFTAEEAARRRAYGNVNTWTGDAGCDISPCLPVNRARQVRAFPRPHQRHAAISVIDGRHQSGQRGNSEVAVNRRLHVVKLPNVDGNVFDSNVANVNRVDVPV